MARAKVYKEERKELQREAAYEAAQREAAKAAAAHRAKDDKNARKAKGEETARQADKERAAQRKEPAGLREPVSGLFVTKHKHAAIRPKGEAGARALSTLSAT